MEFHLRSTVLRFALVIAIVLLSVGCDSTGDRDSERLEHVSPPHKPRAFPALVVALRERISALSRGNPSTEDLDQLSDVIRWIPELAAETDLRRKEWDVAAEVSRRLGIQLDSTRTTGRFGPDDVRKLLDLTELLQPLANLCTSPDISI